MALTCPSCGNDRNFLVKTLQMHVVQLTPRGSGCSIVFGDLLDPAEHGSCLFVLCIDPAAFLAENFRVTAPGGILNRASR